jgi:hypothetical protein
MPNFNANYMLRVRHKDISTLAVRAYFVFGRVDEGGSANIYNEMSAISRQVRRIPAAKLFNSPFHTRLHSQLEAARKHCAVWPSTRKSSSKPVQQTTQDAKRDAKALIASTQFTQLSH